MTRGKRVLLFVSAGLVLVSLMGGGIGWYVWSHSPTYSLKQIVAAVQERDRYRFEHYVDIDSLVQSFAADYTADNPLAMAMVSTLVGSLKAQVTKAIEDGTTSGDSQLGNGVTTLMTGAADLHLEKLGPNAYFSIPIKTKGGAPFGLKFHMTQVPEGYWRVDRATNVKDLLGAEALEEAARKALIAKQIEEKLAQLASVAKLHTSVNADWARKNRFQVRLQNNATQAISGMTGHLACAQAGFDEGVSADVNIPPGQTGNVVWEFGVNQFMAPTERMFALHDTENFNIQVDSITFADGTTVKRGSE